MKENSIKNERSSIEEDIIILEQLIIANENCIKNAKNKDNPFVTVWKKQNIAIEHILSDYKRVLKENERYRRSDYETICLENNELRETVDRIQSEYNDLLKEHEKLKAKIDVCNWQEKSCKEIIQSKYISIQKVKDKIEEEKLPLTIVGGRKNKKTLEYGIKLGRRQALQELIEEREEK